MSHFSDLPGYKKLTKQEKVRFGAIIESRKNIGIVSDEAIVIPQVKTKKTDFSDIPLHPVGIGFVDYRDPIWGDSGSWVKVRPLRLVKYLVFHHSLTSPDATPDDIALIHKARGWKGIGYHFVITKDGKVWYVGDIGTSRANVANMNDYVIGICLVGDFTKTHPADAQIISSHKLSKFFLFNYPAIPNLSGWEHVVGHKNLGATACPGSTWGSGGQDSMEWHIKNGVGYSASA